MCDYLLIITLWSLKLHEGRNCIHQISSWAWDWCSPRGPVLIWTPACFNALPFFLLRPYQETFTIYSSTNILFHIPQVFSKESLQRALFFLPEPLLEPPLAVYSWKFMLFLPFASKFLQPLITQFQISYILCICYSSISQCQFLSSRKRGKTFRKSYLPVSRKFPYKYYQNKIALQA